MNTTTRTAWTQAIYELEQAAARLKDRALHELPYHQVGCHPIVHGLASIEGLCWGLRDAVSRFPTTDEIQREQQQELL